MILALTSFGFSWLAFLAGWVREPVFSPLLSLMAPIGVLHHAHGTDETVHPHGRAIARADRFLARLIPPLVCVRSGAVRRDLCLVTRLSVLYIAVVYWFFVPRRAYQSREIPWPHISIHLMSVIGMTAYLYGWYLVRGSGSTPV